MAKGKLLCFLVALLFSSSHLTIAQNISSTNSELLNNIKNIEITEQQQDWAKELGHAGRILTREAILQKLRELDEQHCLKQGKNCNDKELVDKNLINPAVLKIFVSSGMPSNLLKSYHQQAVKYGGTLVFKGLPNGSFKELTKLVMSISENGEVGSMQIDDEAFDQYGINVVPAILLVKQEGYLGGCFGKSCKVTYDKITGSISVKKALEKFANNGDLSQEAERLLENG
ncbi:type-F conjugative transfer system pilin assembly protein TrbC [Candidatus Tisiphia endosymbiont of Oplodontha viridula]|uniref:type-F conjugative transfer system pilin assembly protein TrbC n=1 Tax=Candidatus Tisiphia endosymbiont of Oplodontha viridula TaxID=3077925 RepID=UPI0035C8A095